MKVALLVCTREGGDCKRSSQMAATLMQDCRQARLSCVDITSAVAKAARAAFFDEGEIAGPAALAKARGAGVILAVLVDIDPKKRGKKTVVFGQETDMIDTRVRFVVVSVADVTTVYEGSLKAVAGRSSEATLAKRSATQMIKNYLVPKCPALTGKEL